MNSAGAVGGFVGAYVVGWLQGGVGDAAAFTFMAVALGLSAVLMFAVNSGGRRTAHAVIRGSSEVSSGPNGVPSGTASAGGVLLQRYHDGGLADAKVIKVKEGLSWKSGERTRTETDLKDWKGARASSGRARLAPDAFSSKMTAQPAALRSSSWLKVA